MIQNTKSILIFFVLVLGVSNGCTKAPSAPTSKSTEDSALEKKLDSNESEAMSQGSPEDVGDTIKIPRPMTVLEFVAAAKKNPKGFSLTCREGTKEFRRVDEKKKVDARFCSADGKVAVSPVLRVQEHQLTLQTIQYRGSYTPKGGALTWLHNDGLLVNFAPNTKEWKVRLADATVHTFMDQALCPFDAELEKKLEAIYGADICSR